MAPNEKVVDPLPEPELKENHEGKNWKATDHVYPINIVYFIVWHIGAFYGVYLCFTSALLKTTFFALVTYYLSLFGIAGGVHRLWSHRAYKAKWPLRLLLAIFNTVAYQNSIYEWARDHRVHHKYTETDADPVNSDRGFFFSHCGWLMCKKHPDVSRIGGKVDMSDILADPIVYYQKKFYMPLVAIFCFTVPTAIPYYMWDETLFNSFFVCVVLRYIVGLNSTWLVNSAAHIWGFRPYDKSIAPAENYIVSLLATGEGFHNFHHSFPWDYSTSEWGWGLNFTTMAIDFFEKIGWAYDLRKVNPQMIEQRKKRTGKTTEHEY